MSEQKIYIAGFIPDEKSVEEFGARKVATAFHAKDVKHAQAKASFLFMEEYPGAQDASYKILICEDSENLTRRPVRDVWDEEYLYEFDWSEELGYPVLIENKPQSVDFGKLSSIMKISVLVKYMTTEITADMLPAALELTQDDANTFPGHIVEAISKTDSIASMYPERIIEAIKYVVDKCPTTKKWPEIKAQLINWLKEHEKEREDGNVKPVVDPVGATEYAGRAYKHTYDTLNKEIAYALWAGDVNPAKTEASISRWAAGIIADDREDWKRWSAVITTQENILEYDRPTIFNLVRSAATKDIHHFPDTLKRYVSDYLQTRGVYEGEAHEKEQPTPQGTTGALADDQSSTNTVEQEQPAGQSPEAPETVTERQGPFYFLMSDGQKFGRANKIAGLEKAISDGGTEISQEEYQARKTGTYSAPQNDAPKQQNQPTSEDTNQPEVKNLGGGVFSVEGLMSEQPKKEEPKPEVIAPSVDTAPPPVEPATSQPTADFQSVGASLEKDLSEKPAEALDNLKLWRTVMRTDPRFTKDITGTGFDGTSVNAEYMIMRATELFGPLGSGWGFEIQEDKLIPGAPMSEPVFNDKQIVGHRFLRDADGTLITEQHHSMRIRLWYETEDRDGSVISYGATPFIYKTKHGVKCDGEAPKKSLTDAIKKALSMLGFSADVWLGLYDKPEYVAEVGIEFGLKTASDKAEDVTRLRTELDEKMTRVASTIESAVTANEAKKVFDTLAREIEIHRKSAEATGDGEHAKYLSGRLRRLNQIKDERIKALNEQEHSA
ncbi:exodeoxyribonuclease VIII [Salmonella enterica]|uniref:exodeoxyribonuclease VIII n=1 Tax=Salmonella enterica TaxID=28901 RepID=UPI000CCC883D|nr:exodeoxyribonuclease VIII [Salmonella enterica]EBX4202686.1 exodeoxyribonuclease VIII [Salmonella enterica subsp. enterica serovar Oakland]EBI3714122.1 exodeoxyribonuclease VIII [Salmonella enterica]EDX5549184.1 exodeoxyribonuclease VIII [Salmonella enterica subsp. enterica serovar Oakland]EEB0427111.1 exodeoxyribonuclease VIII [Salmonella enterica subsp. enterica serovar Oakland]EEM2750424.1 exodeoxyribonuclease VIII [Salmonella enterica]